MIAFRKQRHRRRWRRPTSTTTSTAAPTVSVSRRLRPRPWRSEIRLRSSLSLISSVTTPPPPPPSSASRSATTATRTPAEYKMRRRNTITIRTLVATVFIVLLCTTVFQHPQHNSYHHTAASADGSPLPSHSDPRSRRDLQFSQSSSSWWCPASSSSSSSANINNSATATATADEEEAAAGVDRSETVRSYIIGANTWHMPIIDYLQATINGQTSATGTDSAIDTSGTIRFERMTQNNYLNEPSVSESLSYNYDFIIANPYQTSCYQSEVGAVPIVTAARKHDPSDWKGLLEEPNRPFWSVYGAVLYTTKAKAMATAIDANIDDERRPTRPIQTVRDVRDRVIGTNKFKNMATHLCYDILLRHGLHHIQDPAQTIFFKSSTDALEALLDGRIDVGCAPSQTLESYFDNDLDELQRTIHILDEQQYPDVDGDGKFPWKISSPLVPSYIMTAFPGVSESIQRWMATTLLEMRSYAADIAVPFLKTTTCTDQCQVNDGGIDDADEDWITMIWKPIKIDMADEDIVGLQSFEECMQACFEASFSRPDPEIAESSIQKDQCEETFRPWPWMTDVQPPNIIQALRAFHAINTTRIPGFVLPKSNMKMLEIQKETGMILMKRDDLPQWSRENDIDDGAFPRCVRLKHISDAVHCPDHHFIRDDDPEKIKNYCNVSGLDCYGNDCLCRPCIRAHEVDIVMTTTEEETGFSATSLDDSPPTASQISLGDGCDKFEICGSVPQEGTLRLYALDNRRRLDVSSVTGVVLKVGSQSLQSDGEIEEEMESFTMDALASPSSRDVFLNSSLSSFMYQYDWIASWKKVGQVIVQIYVDGNEIPESPFRVLVTKRDCSSDDDGDDDRREADENGQCVCRKGTVEIGSRCVLLVVLIPTLVGCVVLLSLLGMYIYLRVQRRKTEAKWQISPSELNFLEPPRVLGRGAFGLVLLAEWKGAQVAVKGVLPWGNPKTAEKEANSNDGNSNSRSSPKDMDIEMPVELMRHSDTTEDDKDASHSDSDLGNERVGYSSTLHVDARRMAVAINQGSWTGMSSVSLESIFSSHRTKQRQRESKGDEDAGYRSRPRSFKRFVDQRRHAQVNSDFLKEIRILSSLRHPSIVTVMGCVVTHNYEPMLVLEYMQFGSLHDLLHNDSMLLETSVRLSMLHDVASGLRFLHSSDAIHSDLKSSNVLVDNKFRAKVADFGCSKFRSKKTAGDPFSFIKQKDNSALGSDANPSPKSVRGSPFYMSPELLLGESENSRESDVYSFGIVMFEVWTRKEPFEGENFNEVIAGICDPDVRRRPRLPDGCCPEEAKCMYEKCLSYDPTERPTAMGLDIRLRWLDEKGGLSSSKIAHVPQHASRRQQPYSASFQSDVVLESHFPTHVAEALREGRTLTPETHTDVTVVVLGLVSASSEDDLRFDRIIDEVCNRFDSVVRIETIGSAQMFVTNLENANDTTHALLAVEFSLSVSRLVSTSKNSLVLSVGLHSGPVVSHVVLGRSSVRFTLIGDTVNSATAIHEVSSGKIACSEECLHRLHSLDSSSWDRGSSTLTVRGNSAAFQVVESGVVMKGLNTLSVFAINSIGDLTMIDSNDSEIYNA